MAPRLQQPPTISVSSEDSLSFIFDPSPDLVIIVDKNFKPRFLNKAAFRFLGAAVEHSASVKKFEELGPLGMLIEPVIREVFASKSTKQVDHEVSGNSETSCLFEGLYYPIESPHFGSAVAVCLRDISVRKRTELELRETQCNYEAQNRILNTFDIVAETDRRGRITFANDRFAEISKYSKKELLGQDHRILNSNYHPKSFFRELWAVISRGNVWSGEIRNRAKDGSFYWVSTVITPVFDSQGQFKKFLSVRRDITKEKNAEIALKESELRYRELLNNVKLVAVGLNVSGRITFANQALLECLGKRLDEVLGLDWFSAFIPEDHRERLVEIHSRTLTEDNPEFRYESELLNSTGNRSLIAWTNTLFKSLNGDILGVTTIGEDITAKRRDEKRVAELRARIDKQKEEIITFVSHELRSPLMSIRVSSDLLRDSFNQSPQKQEAERHLQHIQTELARIDRVSRDLMEVSVHRAGELKFDPKPTHLNRLLRDICNRFSDEILARHNLSLKYKSSEAEIVGSWDAGRLDQVVSNLISNAIKYSRESGGEILVSAHPEGDFVHLIVSDQGVGIPSENLESIFELFSRGDNVRKSKTSGFGVGLKIAHDIVQKHDGRIWAESELGKGSQFHVILPLRQ